MENPFDKSFALGKMGALLSDQERVILVDKREHRLGVLDVEEAAKTKGPRKAFL